MSLVSLQWCFPTPPRLQLHNPFQLRGLCRVPKSLLSTASIARTLSLTSSLKGIEAKRAFDNFWGSIQGGGEHILDTPNQIRHSLDYVPLLLMILQSVTFSESTISSDDLAKVGIQGKHLVLVNAKISDLCNEETDNGC